MTDDLSLAPDVIDAQLADAHEPIAHESPWHERRSFSIGCSDLGAVWLALGLVKGVKSPDWLTRNARRIRPHNEPRIFLQKAGLVAPLAVGPAANRGTERELELFHAWRDLLTHKQYACDEERLIVPSSLRHASEVPKEWLPLVDRRCPRLSCTPDAWGRDVLGNLVSIQIKCSVNDRTEAPWYQVLQNQGEIGVQSAAWGLLVCGIGWAAGEWKKTDGPIRSWPVEVSATEADRIRATVNDAWKQIEALRGRKAA